MIVGSVASIIYGEPRMTKDMDLVLDILPTHAQSIEPLFPSHIFYVPPPEILVDEITRRGQFNILHHETGLKIDFVVRKNTEHGKTEFSRRRHITIWENTTASVAAPEDVILAKLIYYRDGGSEKHLLDIRGILCQTSIDQKYLQEWVAKLHVQDEWQKIA